MCILDHENIRRDCDFTVAVISVYVGQ